MPTTRLLISKYAVNQYKSLAAYTSVCMLVRDVKGTRACTCACLCMYMRACVRASVFACLCFCVCLYALEAERDGEVGREGCVGGGVQRLSLHPRGNADLLNVTRSQQVSLNSEPATGKSSQWIYLGVFRFL